MKEGEAREVKPTSGAPSPPWQSSIPKAGAVADRLRSEQSFWALQELGAWTSGLFRKRSPCKQPGCLVGTPKC